MANLNVSYVSGVQYGVAKGISGGEVIVTSGSNAAGTGNTGAPIVALFSDAAHYVNLGAAATAANGFYVPANQIVYLGIDIGEQVNAITA